MRYRLSFLFFFFLVIIFQVHSSAYTIVLKSGKQISGTLISEDETMIKIKDADGFELNFKKEKLDLAKMADIQSREITLKKEQTAKASTKEFKWADSNSNGNKKKEDLTKIVSMNRKTLSKEEREKLAQKIRELSQTSEYKEKLRIADQELTKEQQEAEKQAAEKEKKDKEARKAYLTKLDEKYNQLVKREADLKILCEGNTVDTVGSAVTDIRTDSGDTARATTTYGSSGTSRNLEACSQLFKVQTEIASINREIEALYNTVIRWGQPFPSN